MGCMGQLDILVSEQLYDVQWKILGFHGLPLSDLSVYKPLFEVLVRRRHGNIVIAYKTSFEVLVS